MRLDDPFAVTDEDTKRATKWFQHRGGQTPPSSLVIARLAARHANRQLEMALLIGLAMLLIVWTLLTELIDIDFEVGEHNTSMRGPVTIGVFYILLAAITWWGARRLRQDERRIAQALPRRVASSRQRGAVSVLGWLYLAAFAVTYLGGIIVAAYLAVTGGTAIEAFGAIFAVGTLATGLVAATVIVEALRRPALAEDTASLAVDDLLRTEDARRVAPFPLFVALIAAVDSVDSLNAMWTLLGYAALGMVLWAAAMVTGYFTKLEAGQPEDAR